VAYVRPLPTQCKACLNLPYSTKKNNTLPSSYQITSQNGDINTCGCRPGYIGDRCNVPDCDSTLPQGSLVSLLIQAEPKFGQLSIYLHNNPSNQDYINAGNVFLSTFPTTDVDFNGNGLIESSEVLDTLQYRSVYAIGLNLLNVWNCKTDLSDCSATSVSKDRLFKDLISCFTNSTYHKFDCSGLSIISNLTTTTSQSDNIEYCKLSDRSWRPNSYVKPVTSWAFTPSGKSRLGSPNGKLCIYSNGILIKGAPFNTNRIAQGDTTNFTDPNNNGNVTSFRRVYCIAALLADRSYSYECSSGLFYVSF